MNIFLSGGSGLVGRNILEHKNARDFNIYAPRRNELDLFNSAAIEAYLKKHKIDFVIHAAGLVGGINANIKNPYDFLFINSQIALNLINTSFKLKIPHLLNLASSCAYPKNAPNPLQESQINNGALEPTNEGYALAKILGLKLCEYISTTSNLAYKTAIPCNLFGKYDKFDLENAHLIPAIINKLHSAKIARENKIEIWGDGRARREFMDASELADFIFYAIINFSNMPQNLNVGVGRDYSIDEYYKKIAQIIGFEGEFIHNLDKPSGMSQKLLDISNLSKFGWESSAPLEISLKKVYEYFLKEKSMKNYCLASSTWDEREYEALESVIKSGNFSMGKKVAEFELKFARYVGSKYVIMTSSGSTANLIALASLFYTKTPKLKKGDEIIVPAVSWSTTYFPLYQYGLKIKFVDIDLESLNYDLVALKSAITPSTRAIMVVNLLGNPNDFSAINEMIDGKNIILIEDNCESMGAEFGGKMAGRFGLVGSFSSFFSHHISTMEGGLVVTDDEEIYHILLSLRAHGWTRNLPKENKICKKSDDNFSESFRFILPGYNVRPLELSGAVGICQLEKFPDFLKNRRENAKYFINLFKDSPNFIIQREIGKSSYFGFSLIIKPDSKLKRSEILARLRENNIEFRPIVAGDFSQNEVIRYFDYEIFGELKNARCLHKNGFFVGNHHIDIKPFLSLLQKSLNGGGFEPLSFLLRVICISRNQESALNFVPNVESTLAKAA